MGITLLYDRATGWIFRGIYMIPRRMLVEVCIALRGLWDSRAGDGGELLDEM